MEFNSLIMYNNEICLSQNPLKITQYHIYNCNNEYVGMIEYRGRTHSLSGDIGYMIDKRYQGNGYAYKALCLMGESLRDYGIEDFIISAHKDNFSSLKTIEKYGGSLVKIYGDIYIFKCNTNVRKVKKLGRF